jgi:cytidylate kinase
MSGDNDEKPIIPTAQIVYGEIVYWVTIFAALLCMIGPLIAVADVDNNLLNPHFVFAHIFNEEEPGGVWALSAKVEPTLPAATTNVADPRSWEALGVREALEVLKGMPAPAAGGGRPGLALGEGLRIERNPEGAEEDEAFTVVIVTHGEEKEKLVTTVKARAILLETYKREVITNGHFWMGAPFTGDGFTQLGLALGCSVALWGLIAAAFLFLKQKVILYMGLTEGDFAMAIITISRGSYSKGREIAEHVANRLGYECISRDVLLEASEQFNIPEIKLVRALHDAPGVLDRFRSGKQRYVAFIREAFLRHVKTDKVVYHGLAGHFFLQNVAHTLKVRIIADLEDRVETEMARENVDEETAREILKKDDAERRRWAMALYGIDTGDCRLYDLVMHVRKLTEDDAVDLICDTVQREQFTTTKESQQALDDLVLAASAKSAIVKKWPHAEVDVHDGTVFVTATAVLAQEPQVVNEITRLVKKVPGVAQVRVYVRPLRIMI